MPNHLTLNLCIIFAAKGTIYYVTIAVLICPQVTLESSPGFLLVFMIIIFVSL